MNKIRVVLTAALAAAAVATVTTPAVAAPSGHGQAARVGAPFKWRQTNGSQWIGATSLSAGTRVTTQPSGAARVITFIATTTYFGNPAGTMQFSSGNYLAMTNDCSGATIKSDPSSNGTIWEIDPSGRYLVSRYCDQNGFQGGGGFSNNQAHLGAPDSGGVQWSVCGDPFRCDSFFSRLTEVAPF